MIQRAGQTCRGAHLAGGQGQLRGQRQRPFSMLQLGNRACKSLYGYPMSGEGPASPRKAGKTGTETGCSVLPV